MRFNSSILGNVLSSVVRSTQDPFGTGTLNAIPSNLPEIEALIFQ